MSIVCCLSQSAQHAWQMLSRTRTPIGPGNGARSNPSRVFPQRAHTTSAIVSLSLCRSMYGYAGVEPVADDRGHFFTAVIRGEHVPGVVPPDECLVRRADLRKRPC